MRNFPERDWKQIRKIKDKLIQTACERIFEKVDPVVSVRGEESHQAYLKLWKIMEKEDKKIVEMFDDLKRSTAYFKLAAWRQNGLLSDEDFEMFSEDTQNAVSLILG